MPRNEALRLSNDDLTRQRIYHAVLLHAKTNNVPVEVRYIKRDGSASASTGTVGEFSGRPGCDTGSVTIHTDDKGPRTINLHRIVNVR